MMTESVQAQPRAFTGAIMGSTECESLFKVSDNISLKND